MIGHGIGPWSLFYFIAVVQKYGIDFNFSSSEWECFRRFIYESIISLCEN